MSFGAWLWQSRCITGTNSGCGCGRWRRNAFREEGVSVLFLTTIVVIQSLVSLFGRTIKPELTSTNQCAILTIDIQGPSYQSYPSEPQVLRNHLDGVSIVCLRAVTEGFIEYLEFACQCVRVFGVHLGGA